MLARTAVAEARAAQDASNNRRVHLWSEASHVCTEPRCATVMRIPWRELNAIFAAEGNTIEAAKAAVHEVQQISLAAPSEARPYVRTAELDRACEALDAQSGAGACRKLEKQLNGSYTFHDFSKRTLPGTGLPPEEIKKVAEHFSISLQECLAAEAARLERGNPELIRLSWSVLNDGRPDSIRVEDHPRDAGPLGACVRRQVAIWRYPKYRGEWQHVEQEFRIENR